MDPKIKEHLQIDGREFPAGCVLVRHEREVMAEHLARMRAIRAAADRRAGGPGEPRGQHRAHQMAASLFRRHSGTGPPMKHVITVTVYDEGLRSLEDAYLHAMWHAAQLNPSQHGARAAGEIVAAITQEIVRRWLAKAPVEMFRHQPTDHYWRTLVRRGSWEGPEGEWVPRSVAPGCRIEPNREGAPA